MTLGVHYESPVDDPFRVPRPHWHDLTSNTTRGGEIGACTLLGLVPNMDSFEVSTLEDVVLDMDAYKGWFPVFVQDGGMVTYECPVYRVEVV